MSLGLDHEKPSVVVLHSNFAILSQRREGAKGLRNKLFPNLASLRLSERKSETEIFLLH
jgi:hypothetical protein